MDFEWWKENALKASVALLGWIGIRVGKNHKAIFKSFKKFTKAIEVLDKHELDIAINKNLSFLYFDHHPEPIFIRNTLGSATYVNEAFLDLTGLAEDEALGFGYLEVFQEEYYKDMLARNERMKIMPSPSKHAVQIRNVDTGKHYDAICRTEIIHNHNKEFAYTFSRLSVVKSQ